MREIIAGLFCSIDGVVDAPHQWNGPYMNEEIGQTIASSLSQADGLLLATKTYQDFASYWPHETANPLAGLMNSKRKYVVSNSLRTLEWQSSILIPGKDWVSEVRKLKEGGDNHIQVPGSPSLVRSLMGAGLLDRLHVIVCPVVVGGGTRLFDDVAPKTIFQISEATTIRTGAARLTFVPVK